ncbi:aldo/keto reductase [Haloferula sp.]|uniref:aldo/keto reductase n=1 Tax=Haloferula sp. TaxID=2497595 RepID=UPI00329F1B41
MHYKLLGNSGLRVSELCYGAWRGWTGPKEDCLPIYRAFLDAGGNFVDTANVYGDGRSETYLGEFCEDHREELVIATKYSGAVNATGRDPNAGGNHRKSIIRSCEESLKRLRTDYIDVYWMHGWDEVTPVEEVMRAFDDLVRQGKVLHCGVSNTPAWWIAQANTIARFSGWTPFDATQIEYSLVERTVEREIIPAARALGMSVLAWSPLAGGVLAGKGAPAPESREARILKVLEAIAKDLGRTPAQVALSWLRQASASTIPIIGASRVDQLLDNLGCLEFKLDDQQRQSLSEASAIEAEYPMKFLRTEGMREVAFGGLFDRIDAP